MVDRARGEARGEAWIVWERSDQDSLDCARRPGWGREVALALSPPGECEDLGA